MHSADTLLEAAAQVDVLVVAGRIIGNPRRHSPSATSAEVLALACASKRLWKACLMAEAMLEAATAEPSEDEEEQAKRETVASELISLFTNEMAALRGETTEEEKTDGESQS
jgi:hypothetical protein